MENLTLGKELEFMIKFDQERESVGRGHHQPVLTKISTMPLGINDLVSNSVPRYPLPEVSKGNNSSGEQIPSLLKAQ